MAEFLHKQHHQNQCAVFHCTNQAEFALHHYIASCLHHVTELHDGHTVDCCCVSSCLECSWIWISSILTYGINCCSCSYYPRRCIVLTIRSGQCTYVQCLVLVLIVTDLLTDVRSNIILNWFLVQEIYILTWHNLSSQHLVFIYFFTLYWLFPPITNKFIFLHHVKVQLLFLRIPEVIWLVQVIMKGLQ